MTHVAILDFGSQYTHLITRRIREFDVLAKIYPNDIKASDLPNDVIGIILSGGPQSVYDVNAPQIDKNILYLNKPVLGICYGHQLMAQALGGSVKAGTVREYGRAELNIIDEIEFLNNISTPTTVWMSHGDTVKGLPNGFKTIASTADCPITSMADEDRNFYGLQFHPEVDHTIEGVTILKNFVLNICKAEQNWHVEDIINNLQEKIKKQVGDPVKSPSDNGVNKKVFILVSGGVDSNVAFSLLTKTLGEERVKGLYIDTGFMRKDESDEIKQGFINAGFKNFEAYDASDIFFKNLENIYEPEEKRNIIGQTFLDVKDAQIKKLGLNSDEWLLGQGTIYPDIIESGGSKNAQKIKTHHNRVDAIKKMIAEGKIIEPLVDFYKFEVRAIGKILNLPANLINRHPFPGPGLAIRCLCHEHDKIDNVSIVQKETNNFFAQKYKNVNQQILPFKSVGVQGDNRTYAHPLAVWGENDWDKLDALASSVTNSIKDVNRVILLLNPPSQQLVDLKISPEDMYLSLGRIKILREIDDIVMSNIKEVGIYDDIWQFAIVLLPITNDKNRESIVLRPINTRDLMTINFYRMNKKILNKMIAKILATGKISYVFYDITNKPPGTFEWE